jgi:DNA modification methylase
MIRILQGNCMETLKTLESESINTCVTSPPYWGLRDYNGEKEQLGLEATPQEFVDNLVAVFREVKRVLRKDGTLWLNLGDSYNAARNGGHAGGSKQNHKKYLQRSGENVVGLKPKDLIGIPWRVAFALQQDGWYLRQDIIWHKPNPMPESVKDRCTKAHEYIFLLSKSPKYYYDNEAIKEDAKFPGGPTAAHAIRKGADDPKMQTRGGLHKIGANPKRNKRSVWTITTKPYKEAHFATFPKDLIEPCVLAGCPEGGTVLDPFGGSGTTAQVANDNQRDSILCELSAEYIEIAKKRLHGMFSDVIVETIDG